MTSDSIFRGTLGDNMELTSGARDAITIALDGATISGSAKVTSSASNDTIRLTDVTIAHGGLVTGPDIDLVGMLTLDFQDGFKLDHDAAFLNATGTIRLDDFTGLQAAGYQQLDRGKYTVVKTSDRAVLDMLMAQAAALTDTEHKAFSWMAHNNDLQLVVTNIGDRIVQNVHYGSYEDHSLDGTIFIGGEGLAVTCTYGDEPVGADHEISVGELIVEGGSTLHLNMVSDVASDTLDPGMDGKNHVSGIFRLKEGSTFKTTGAYFFIGENDGLNILGDATIINEGSVGVVYTTITGTGDAETDKGITLTFDPGEIAEGDNGTKLTSFVGRADFGGTLEFNNRYTLDEDGNRVYAENSDRYFIDIPIDNLSDATDGLSGVNVQLGENVKLGYNGDLLNVGGLSGDSTSAIYLAEDPEFLDGIDGVNIDISSGVGLGVPCISISGDFNSTFSGTIGSEESPVDLEIINNGSQTLDHATIYSYVYVDQAELTLHNMEEMDLSNLSVYQDSTINFGKGEYLLDSCAMNIEGYVNVLEGGEVTIDDMIPGILTSNAGTLILTQNGDIDLSDIVNTGDLYIGDPNSTNDFNYSRYIGGDIGGTVTVIDNADIHIYGDISADVTVLGTVELGGDISGTVTACGNSHVSLTDDSVFTGALQFDLTGYDPDSYANDPEDPSSFLVNLGDADLSGIKGAKIVNYGVLDREDLFPLATGTEDAMNFFADALNESNPSLHHDYTFVVVDGMLQVQVLNYGEVTIGDVFTWHGTSNQEFDGGTFVPTKYVHGELERLVMVNDEDVRGWDTAEGTMATTVRDLFGQEAPAAALRFAPDYGKGLNTLTIDFSPASISALIVEEGAMGYSIVQKGGQTLRLGAEHPIGAEEKYMKYNLSIIKEDFSISTSRTILQGRHDLHVAEGKTFRIDNSVSVTGKVDFNSAVDAAGKLNTSSGLYTTSTGKLTVGRLGLSNGAEFTMHAGSMQASTIVLHDTPGENGTEAFTIKSGILTVTGRNNGNDSAAIMLGQQANSGKSIFNIEGGVVNVFPGRVMLSYQSSGELNITGGELNAYTLDFGYKDNGGKVTLADGARLNIGAGGIVNATSKDTLTVTGGTLGTLAAGNWTGNSDIVLDVAAGKVFTIDTQKHDARVDGAALVTGTEGAITLTGVLSGRGDIDKVGKGTLTLGGDNTATGKVHVKEGELQIKNGGADSWTSITVDSGAVLTYAAGSAKTDISNVTNNGSLHIGNSTVIGDGEWMKGHGSVVVLGGGELTTHEVYALEDASRITVNANGTLDLSNGFRQSEGQHIQNYGELILGGEVTLRNSLTSTKINNTGVLTINQDVRFNMDAWADIVVPGTELTKTFTIFTGMGHIQGNDLLDADNFYLAGKALTNTPVIRSVSMDDKGVLTVRYWGTLNTAVYDTDTALDEFTLNCGKPETVSVAAGKTVTVGKLTTSALVESGTAADMADKYTLTKRGDGTLQVLSVPTDDIECITVIKGNLVLGTAPENGEEGTRAIFNIGSSRISGMGGSLENVALDCADNIVTNVDKDAPAVLRDIRLRLGNLINNDTSLSNVQFAGTSAVSGYVTVDAVRGIGMHADISVADGATLSIGTTTNDKLAFNFMPGTITDEGADGSTHAWDQPLITIGNGATLVNWDDEHVSFYYNGVLTKGVISIGGAGSAHIDTTKAPELLWNGTAAAWNPTDTLSQGWYEGEKTGITDHVHVHDWKGYAQESRFYALSNVHFNTLAEGLNSDIMLGQDLTVFNFTIGGKLEDSAYGDVNGNGIIDSFETGSIAEDGTIGGDPKQTVYNKTAYTFSSGNLTVLRDLYVRTAADVVFEGNMGVTAQNVRLYSSSDGAHVIIGGKLTAENLTIGHRSVLSDSHGDYTFGGAVDIKDSLSVHVDAVGNGAPLKVNFRDTVDVGGDATISGTGTKGFAGKVSIGGNLTVGGCPFTGGTGLTAFAETLTVAGDLIIQDNGQATLHKRNSNIGGVVKMYNGTLTMADGTGGTFDNDGKDWTIRLFGDDGTLRLTSDTAAHIANLSSGDGSNHSFTIAGDSLGTDIQSMSGIENLDITGGKVTLMTGRGGAVESIHGDLTVKDAELFLNAKSVFTTGNAHTVTVADGSVSASSGTTQTLAADSKIVLHSGSIFAPVTNNDTKATFIAEGDLGITFSGESTFGANLNVAAGAHTLAIAAEEGAAGSILYTRGAIVAQGDSRIEIGPGTKVSMDGPLASFSGEVVIRATHEDDLSFLNSTLNVTLAGQIDNARITVMDSAGLDVSASTPVNVASLTMETDSTLVLSALTGTKEPDASLSCIQVTDSADLSNHFNLYFRDDLETQQTYALVNLLNGSFAAGTDYHGLVDVYVREWTDKAAGTFNIVKLDRDQYDLQVADGKTLYLTTFFGMVWSGADTGNGTWSIEDANGYWSGKDFKDGSTAIFRDLQRADSSAVSNAQVTLQGEINTDTIYVGATTTDYTFVNSGATLANGTDDAPALIKEGAASLTLRGFTQAQLESINIREGSLGLRSSNINLTDRLTIADSGTLQIHLGSSLNGKLSSLGTTPATFSNLTLQGDAMTGASPDAPGRVSSASVVGYTIQDVTFSGANMLSDTTFKSGVSNTGSLTLAGTTVFQASIANSGTATLYDDAVVDIGALNFTKNVEYGDNLAQRLHTYSLFTADSTGGIEGPADQFNNGNVMLNGILISQFKNERVKVHSSSDATTGTIVLELDHVETTRWDAAWGIPQDEAPWLGHLILTGDGRLKNGNYMYYDNNANDALNGEYRYSQLISDSAATKVDKSAVSIVRSYHIADAEGKVAASGYDNLKDGNAPEGEIWVYDTGSRFSTKIAGYVDGEDVFFETDGTTIRDSGGRIETNDLVTYMVLDNTDPDHPEINTNLVVGGSVYTNSRHRGIGSTTHVSIMDDSIHVNKMIAGNVYGDLEGDTHVFIHAGSVEDLTMGGSHGSVQDAYLTVDGGKVGTIHGGSDEGSARNVHAQLLAGEVGGFSGGAGVTGDITVDFSSKVSGTTLLEASSSNGTATLNLLNENGYNAGGDRVMFDLTGVQVEGFDVINVGDDALVKFNMYGNFMTKAQDSHNVRLTGSGRVLLGNSDDSFGHDGTGSYRLIASQGVVLQLDTSFIHQLGDAKGNYPTIAIEDGATFDISGLPANYGGGIGAKLEISGHGVDGKGALYRDGSVGMREDMEALPYIAVKGNASIGGTEALCTGAPAYGTSGEVDLSDGGKNHTLTKQGGGTWRVQRMTFEGGTLYITDGSTLQLSQNSSSSPFADPTANGGIGSREQYSTTDVVLDPRSTMLIDDTVYTSPDGGRHEFNSFSARSLSGNGTLLLNGSRLYIFRDAGIMDFYDEFKDSTQQYWNSEGYSYAVFGGKIVDMGATGANMLVKAGNARQFLSGSESTYDGTTRLDGGILYLLGTSYGTVEKNHSSVSSGVLGTSHIEWNGGTITLGNGVHIYNNGQATSGAEAVGDVSEMVIRVNALTSTVDDKRAADVDHSEVYTADDGTTYYRLLVPEGVETVHCHGIYEDGTTYFSGDLVDHSKNLYVNVSEGTTSVNVNSTLIVVQSDSYTAEDGTVYHKVDTTGLYSLAADGVYLDGTKYEAGQQVDHNKELYVQKAENSTVYVRLEKARYDDATYSGVLSDASDGKKGKLVKVGLGTLTIDQYNSYTGGTDVQAGTLNVKGWGLLGGVNSGALVQTAGSSLMLSYDGSYGSEECFFMNTDMELSGRGDKRWVQENAYDEATSGGTVVHHDGDTAALISNIGADSNSSSFFTLAGRISGDGDLLHMGAGTLYLDGWSWNEEAGLYMHNPSAAGNTYSGGTTVTNGRLFVRKDAGLGATALGGDANLVTASGTEVHFEDCDVTLAATKTDDYAGNDIQGAIVIGTPDGNMRSTGATPSGDGTMQLVTSDVKVAPTTVTIQGSGYWAESTMIDQDGTLKFEGAAASNTIGGPGKAGYLEGTGHLVLENDGSAGALTVEFSDIGTATEGFNGNITVQGKDARLILDDGDYDATKSTKQYAGNITIAGDNVSVSAKDSAIVIGANKTLTISSDASKGAGISGQSVTIAEHGTLEVIRMASASTTSLDNSNLETLKKASSLDVAGVAAVGAKADPAPTYVNIDGAGMVNGVNAYDRVYDPTTALNADSVGVVDTGSFETGPLRLAASSNLKLINSSVSLNGSALSLQHITADKISLTLEFPEYGSRDLPQIVLFTDVEGLYISGASIYDDPAESYDTLNQNIFVFQANEYFKDCWQVTDKTLMVYDTRAKVIYLEYAIPEPATATLSMLALAALAARRRRRK